MPCLSRFTVLMIFSAFLVSRAGAADGLKKRWEQMEYGPYISGTFTIDNDFTFKGLLVRLDKEKQVYACYDEETFRVSGAWVGGFIDFANVIYDGEHHKQPKPKGTLQFTTRPGPGWAKDGSFEDPRKECGVKVEPGAQCNQRSGPLGADWLKYKGLYLHGEKVVFSYTVGDCKVLEMPGVQYVDGNSVFTRTLNLSASTKPLQILIGTLDGATGSVDAAAGNIALLTSNAKEKQTAACLFGAPAGAEWDVSGARIVLKLPALKEPANFTILIANHPKFGTLAGVAPEKLDELTKGGPPRWPETVATQGSIGAGEGAFAVDTITAPDKNPWNSWMRFGGFDFFADGKRVAICTWSGDVWIVSGIDEGLQNLTWKRFATGLYQPLGLKIVDDVIYTTGRDQITRLHDLNNDGEADFYECFNNDCVLTRHFHEFSHDLQTDAEGNFYYAKGATPGMGGPNFDVWSSHNGCFFKLPKDGSRLEVVARGLRAPNGIAIGPNGEMTCGDNEGSWVPECPINWIKQGGFVGIPDGVPGDVKPTKRDDPICWIPWHVDNSSGAQVWVTGDKWGPFKGHMLHLSYGMCSLFDVMMEHVGDTIQGGIARFPINFGSGIMRARFGTDGNLYVCGLRGWQTTASHDGIFQRVRYTGKPIHMPIEMHITKTGVDVTFTDALDPASANDTENYAAWWFNVKWTKDYGSDRYSPTDPTKKYGKQVKDPPGDLLDIKSVKLGADGKTVSIEIPSIKPVTNMVLRFKLKAADGTSFSVDIDNTINRMP